MRALLPGSASAPEQGGSPASGGHRESKGGQGLHLGICHPEPPIGAHWGLLPLQRVCKGESRVQAVSWLCLTGDGDHVHSCVATLGHRQARELLAETDFASPFQAASRSKTKSTGSCCVLPAPGTHSQKCLHSSLGGHCLEAPWKAKCQEVLSLLTALFASSGSFTSLALFRFPSSYPHP